MKRISIIIASLFLFGLGWYYFKHPLTSKIKIRNTIFMVDVALTGQQKALGLGGRLSMPVYHGMLFPYDHKEQYEYWMKGMRFPLDIIWIDGDRVVDLSLNIPPPKGQEQPIIVKPSVPVNRILELNAGTATRIGIRIGDTVEYIDR